jgi:muramoyltetrapeptide carboxypeptidase
MQRRNFLQKSALAVGGFWAAKALSAEAKAAPVSTDPAEWSGKHPPYLKAGDFVGVTCPAGSIEYKDAKYCEVMLAKWGLRTKIGDTVGKKLMRFAGTDEERAEDFQRLLDDPYIKAIIFGRGGYGTMRMMDKINWDSFKKNPKWLVGYSDITAFHCHVNRNFRIATLHSRMAGGFGGAEDISETSLKNALTGKLIEYSWKSTVVNRPGRARGELVGGNLSLIYAMQASASELDTTNKILFIEDVSEYKYTVDRMLMNLKRSGKLAQLAGLIVGGFTNTKTEGDGYFKMSMEELIYEKVKEYNYPVCFNFPAGHQSPNLAIKLGMPYYLEVDEKNCKLYEPGAGNNFLPIPIADSVNAPLDSTDFRF